MDNSFFVHITLPDVFTSEFYDLIPQQRMLVNELLEKRVVLNYSLDMARKNVWIFIAARNETEVMDVLSTFPILKFVRVSIHELAFYDSAPVALPDLILN